MIVLWILLALVAGLIIGWLIWGRRLSEYATAASERDGLRTLVGQHESAAAAHQTKIAQFTSERDAQAVVVADLERKLASVTAACEDHSAALTAAQATASERAALAADLESRLGSAESLAAERESALSAVQGELEGNVAMFGDLQGRFDAATVASSDLQTQLETVQAARGDLQSQLESAQAERADLQGRLDSAAAGFADVQTHLDAAHTERNELQTQLVAAHAERSELQAQLDSAMAERADVQAQLDSAMAERADVQAQLDSAMAERADVQAQLDSAMAERVDVQAQLESADATRTDPQIELETVNVATAGPATLSGPDSSFVPEEATVASFDGQFVGAGVGDASDASSSGVMTSTPVQAFDTTGQSATAFADTSIDLDGAQSVLGSRVKVDDLKLVEGIGPKIEELLHGGGITTWSGLAGAPVEQLKGILEFGGDRFRMHNPESWPRQAALLSKGRWVEFKELTDSLTGGR